MNINQLQPAKNFALNNGVKMVAYGPPGKGKTPAMKTAPRPVILVCEPGMMTMRDSNIPAWGAPTFAQAREFVEWATQSAEAKAFDTICVDSGSELAETCLKEQMKATPHGMKAYGKMSELCMQIFDALFHVPQKHVYIICKQGYTDTISTRMESGMPVIETVRKAEPLFPGKDLPAKFAHRYDLICQVNRGSIPGTTGEHEYFRCKDSAEITARDRSLKLAEFEPLNLTALFQKAMS